jgi:threonyl-tRNA synthetase
MKIRLPDGNTLDLPADATPRDAAQQIGAGLAKAAIGARVNGELVDVHRPFQSILKPRAERSEASDQALDDPIDLSIVTAPRFDKQGKSKWRDDQHRADALYLLRHSCAHVMAEAIQRLWPAAQLAYGPPLDNGFYYDIALDTPISADDFERIEAEMKQIAAEQRPFTRYELDSDTGMKKLWEEDNKYKVDNAERALAGGAKTLSWYVTGRIDNPEERDDDQWITPPQVSHWEDLCQGPHVPDTSLLDPASGGGAFKVMSIASSHWHGDVESDRFQRVYGTAFFSQADLEEHLALLEEAKQRDHRVVGQRLGLFAIDEKVGQGLVLWKPAGAIIRQELQNFISEHLTRQGYFQVFTPHIGKLDLYRTSGHFPYYADAQFPPLIDRETIAKLADENCSCADLAAALDTGEIEGYLLRPMNCPHHIRIYASEKHSYRDLPIRLAEFGTVYRFEQSGELGGMTRVRGFTQDDAHLFVTPEQLPGEVMGCIELVRTVFKTLGMEDYRVRVGLRDPDNTKFVGESADWDLAEKACLAAAESLGVPYSKEPGEAAFYGPKIDFVVKDVIGREWQLGTVQVDYQLPQRFELTYVGADNKPHRPVMIHRAPFGSMERFVGVLIEHFNGAFPLWLAPEQARVLPISDKFVDYAQQVAGELKGAGLRVTVDEGNERLNAKIKAAQEDKVPYMLVVGGKDAEAGTVSVRHRSEGDRGAVPLAEFKQRIVAERDERRTV